MALSQIYNFPEFQELQEAERDRMVELGRDSFIGRMFPLGSQAGDAVSWDKKDPVTGLIPEREVGDPLTLIDTSGGARFSIPSMFFGAKSIINAKDVVSRGQYGSLSEPVDIGAHVDEKLGELQFMGRQTMDFVGSRLLNTGTIPIITKNGTVGERWQWGEYKDRLETLATLKWTDKANADPIGVMHRVAVRRFRGTGFTMTNGFAAMSPAGVAILLQTDSVKKALLGKFGGSTVTLTMFNDAFRGTYPEIIQVDGGAYLPDGTFAPYVDDNKIIFIGAHAMRGTEVGQYVLTTNDQVGVGENLYANTGLQLEFPRNPYVEFAFQGNFKVLSANQMYVVEFASANDVTTYFA
jgi:hypothetical protein